jgi:hypothetical protein
MEKTVFNILEDAWLRECKKPEGSFITAGQIEKSAGPLGQDIIHAINILGRYKSEFRNQPGPLTKGIK